MKTKKPKRIDRKSLLLFVIIQVNASSDYALTSAKYFLRDERGVLPKLSCHLASVVTNDWGGSFGFRQSIDSRKE
jgi:hypothetical protein